LSSNSRPERRRAFAFALTLAFAALLAALAAAPTDPAAQARDTSQVRRRPRPRPRPPTAPIVPAPPAPVVTAADESLAFARSLVHEIRAQYGGDDNWALMAGLRYDMSYTIPGPGGAPVRAWTETHFAWFADPPRARIDTIEDSTIVIVSGDTTRVRQGGAWLGDEPAVAVARSQALDVVWAWRLPRNLGNPAIRAKLMDPVLRGAPFTVRYFYERPGLDRPEGTILDVTFGPPTYTIRRLHWFDPRAKSWFALELDVDRMRYGWTWAERRTLYASNEAGENGPVVWTAVVQDMQIENTMPVIVLSPPGAGIGVVPPAVPAAADSSRR
jgi:hypothetical protein